MEDIVAAFKHGGDWMWPIFGVAILVVGIAAERIYRLYATFGVNKTELMDTLEKCIRSNDIERALKILRTKAPLVKVLKAGVQNFGENKATVQLLMDEAALAELPRIETRTGFLVMFSNVSTLLGLLGTIIGLIRSFAAVANASASEKATELARGISEAMNCTAFGLTVAIPALLIYALLKSREHKLVDDINESTVTLYNIISDVKRSQGIP
jgi:biopolymer transport protein ExbB/TolQ